MAAALGLSLASASAATPIGPSCGTCQGSVYDLTFQSTPIATTAATETWRITYTIDTAGYSGSGSFLDTVALKVASSFEDATLISAPGGVANWVEMQGGLNAAGCSGSGSGYDCVRVAALVSAPVVPGATYTWVFDVEVSTGSLFGGNGEASVKARYVDANGRKKGALVSEGITLSTPSVPEPGLAALLSVAGLGLGGRALRRRGGSAR